MRRKLSGQDAIIISQQGLAIDECMDINTTANKTIGSLETKVDLLEEQIDLVAPAWYDHFWMGVVATVVVGAGTWMVVK